MWSNNPRSRAGRSKVVRPWDGPEANTRWLDSALIKDDPTAEAWGRHLKIGWHPKDDPSIETWGGRAAAGWGAWDDPTAGTLETVGGLRRDPMGGPPW